MNQVHLVVVSEFVCDVSPRFGLRPCPAVQRRFESRDSCVQLRPHTHPFGESSFELAQAQSNSIREFGDADLTVAEKDFIRRGLHTIALRPSKRDAQQKIVGDLRSLLKGTTGAKPFLKVRNRRTNRGPRFPVMVG